nr:pectate lyase [uncultured bacterium]
MKTISLICLAISAGILDSVAAARWNEFAQKADDWYRGDEGRRVASNILSHQSLQGSWPKNTDTTARFFNGDLAKIQGTFDNGATTDELRFLARAFVATKEKNYESAFRKGFEHILAAQYANGGWPQYSPPPKSYHRHITFNDNSMVRLMIFLREVTTSNLYSFVEAPLRTQARESFDRGVRCILKCQIVVNGHKTAWCAQHDETDFSPRSARSYELPSLSGSESVGIVRLLMSLDQPSRGVIDAITNAVAWFESAKLPGIKTVQETDPNSPKGWNRVVVKDESARPMWARFYDINTNKPFFCDRDGVPKPSLAEIGYERRNGYAWLGYWPEDLLAREYPAWKMKWLKPKERPAF